MKTKSFLSKVHKEGNPNNANGYKRKLFQLN